MQGIPVAYDTALPQNGVNMNVGTPLSVPYTRFGAQPVGSYAMPGSQWVSGYMMAQPMAQVDDQVSQSVCFTNTSVLTLLSTFFLIHIKMYIFVVVVKFYFARLYI